MTILADALAGSADLFVPAFEVSIGGQKLARRVVRDVLEVSYHNSLDEFGGFALTLANWDADDYKFAYSDDHLFDAGGKLDLRMGYLGSGRMNWMVRGIVTELAPSFPAAGPPTLQVSGRNRLYELLGQRKSRVLAAGLDSILLEAIFGGITGVRLELDPAIFAAAFQVEAFVQENEFDLLFFKRRARQLGYELIVSEDDSETVIRLVSSTASGDAPLRLAYRGGAKAAGPLIEFQPRFSVARQPAALELNSWDPVKKEPIAIRIERAELKVQDPGFDRDPIADAVSARTEVVSADAVQDVEEGRRRAVEYFERLAKETMTATGRTVGLPELRAGTVLQIAGVGKEFSGRWFVTATDHTIGAGGYTTSFNCRREEL